MKEAPIAPRPQGSTARALCQNKKGDMMKFLEQSDEKFVSAAKSSSGRAELIKRMSQTRLFSMIVVVCAGVSFLLGVVTKTPPQAWLFFLLLFGMVMGQNADQQIKMLKCLSKDKETDKA